MDATTRTIVTFVDGVDERRLSDDALHHAKRRVVDSLACAIGALDSPTAAVARTMARMVSAANPSTVIGSQSESSPEGAAFANTALIRYLDFNDMYFAPGGGGIHPSDVIATSLAVGESIGASGREVLASIVVGYEVLGRLAGTVRLRELGFDQGIHVVVAAAMAAGKLLRLDAERLGHAVALAVIPNITTRATRVGELSMWKGCATAGAARNGIFAAQLAEAGMTGPPEPYDGFDGIKHRVTGPFELDLEPSPDSFVIEQIHTKFRPAEYNAQGPIDLILRMRPQAPLDAIERIEVDTYWLAYSEIGMEPAKWDPQTRETADHSIPYLLAVALQDGEVSANSFTPDRVLDPALRPLMQRIEVREDPDHSRRFPAELPCRITITLRDGQRIQDEIAHPKGHTMNPLSDAEIDTKFDDLARTRSAADREICEAARAACWSLEAVGNIRSVMEPLGRLGSA